MISAQSTVFFDRDHLLLRVEGDESFLRELVEAFEISQKECLAGLRAALAGGDAAALEEHAHSLKGALQNFASGGIVALAYRLELMGRNREQAEAPLVLQELEREVDLLRAYLQGL